MAGIAAIAGVAIAGASLGLGVSESEEQKSKQREIERQAKEDKRKKELLLNVERLKTAADLAESESEVAKRRALIKKSGGTDRSLLSGTSTIGTAIDLGGNVN